MFSESVPFQKHSGTTGLSWEEVHKLKEIIGELILNKACYINTCLDLDGYRVTKLCVLDFKKVEISCSLSQMFLCKSAKCCIHNVNVNCKMC